MKATQSPLIVMSGNRSRGPRSLSSNLYVPQFWINPTWARDLVLGHSPHTDLLLNSFQTRENLLVCESGWEHNVVSFKRRHHSCFSTIPIGSYRLVLEFNLLSSSLSSSVLLVFCDVYERILNTLRLELLLLTGTNS